MPDTPAIEMRRISKSFGSVVANKDIDLSVQNGEIHALLGENGAGKSTLMNMLSGIYRPDSGSIFVGGQEVRLASPKDSIAKGIGMIHQHFKLVDVMTAAENIALGGSGVFLDRKKLEKQIVRLSDRYGLDVVPGKKVYDMSVGEKQTLEIIKVLYRGARILIMDEPTAVLTPQEIDKLFTIIRNMKTEGNAIVIITHKLGEVMEISDRITVLRRGESIGTLVTRDTDIPTLIEMMVGRRVDLSIGRVPFEGGLSTGEGTSAGEGASAGGGVGPLLRADGLTVVDHDKKQALGNVGFELHGGEILGVAGVAGSGQKELCETIAGLQHAEKGRIFFEGGNILGKSPRDIIKLGIRMGFIPEDRLGMGLVGSMDIVHNIILKEYQNQKGIVLRRGPSAEKAKKIVERLEIHTPSIYTPVSKLSGGNIQKVLLGREIDSDPKVLITAYPVRGLDIGASYRIYDLLNEQKAKGVGIIFIGEDLDVLLELCDRIMVLSGGRITGVLNAEYTSKEEIGFLMAGGAGAA